MSLSAQRATIFYWCQETALVPFETGIQRVVRRLAIELAKSGAAIVPVGWNPQTRQVETLPTESSRGYEPLGVTEPDRAIMLVPELPLTLVGQDLDPIQLARAYGMRTAALIHDLIPIKLASDYPPEIVALYRSYYRRSASADLVFTTTNYVAADLRRFVEAENLRHPAIEVINLPAELPSVPRQHTLPPPRAATDPLNLVAVATWEPRKNILRVLKAMGRACADGDVRISLDLIGRRCGFRKYDDEVLSVAERVPSVTIHGTVSDATLVELHARSHASIYPSLEEGFGMPILESLWLGRPCLCHGGSAMAEIAPGGGTLLIDMSDEQVLVDTLTHLTRTPETIARLAGDAIARPLRDWAAYADDVLRRLARRAPRRAVN